jgi:hypothetical protein
LGERYRDAARRHPGPLEASPVSIRPQGAEKKSMCRSGDRLARQARDNPVPLASANVWLQNNHRIVAIGFGCGAAPFLLSGWQFGTERVCTMRA